jgi:WD40 repeat protein
LPSVLTVLGLNTGQCFQILEEHNNWINSIAFSPDGSVFASGDIGQTIKL